MNRDENRLIRSGLLTGALLVMALVLLALSGCKADGELADSQATKDHEAAAMEWRERRLNRLTGPYDWLSLIGLDFLDDGQYRIGSDPSMDLVLPSGPALWGTLVIDGLSAEFRPASDEVEFLVDGEPVGPTMLYPFEDQPVFVAVDPVRFQIVERSGRLGVRSRSSQAESLVNFQGLDYFDFNPDWVIEARFEYNEPGATLLLGSVLGDLIDQPSLGRAVFEFEGQEYSLEAVGDEDDDEMFFIFADRTSGRETYGLGRYMYADAPDGDRILLDFNRAYNPPCAFNEYTTCSLPPPENRLNVRVEAGELAYRGEGGWDLDDL